ncbi:MAG: nucleotidyltransferase domain-containing protein [Bacteroidetes bacterium]|nr:nucleotidyltransferase domain-containing protein [Bacteroidota bacterium]
MLGKQYSFQQTILELREREKELKCIYRVEESVNKKLPVEDFLFDLLKRIPNGWQYPEICRVKITFEGNVYKEPHWEESEWKQEAPIIIDEQVLGKIEVYYIDFKKLHRDSQFLPQEQKLLHTIANRVSDYIFDRRLDNTIRILQQEIDSQDKAPQNILSASSDIHWQWRKKMAGLIANKMDFDRFGVKGVYLIGSTKTTEAGPASDIDLLIYIPELHESIPILKAWLEGWSLCLSEMNYQKTGFTSEGLLDVHFVTDEDIRNKTSYAVMIGSIENSAHPIKVIKN